MYLRVKHDIAVWSDSICDLAIVPSCLVTMPTRDRLESVRDSTPVKGKTFLKSIRDQQAIEIEEWKEQRSVHPSKSQHGSLEPGPMKTRPPSMSKDNKRYMAKRASKLGCLDDEKYRNDSVSAHDMCAEELRRRRSTFKDLIRPVHMIALDEVRRYSRSSLFGGPLNIGGTNSTSIKAENSHTPQYSQTQHSSFMERRKSSVSFRENRRKTTIPTAFNRTSICNEVFRATVTLQIGKSLKRRGKSIVQVHEEQQLQTRRKSKMDSMGTCTYVKVRHILSEKIGLIADVYKQLQLGWLTHGHRVPPIEFAKLAEKFSECKSAKLGGDRGWIPRAKPGTAGPFQEVAFSTPVGSTSEVFRSLHGYHIVLIEGRKN